MASASGFTGPVADFFAKENRTLEERLKIALSIFTTNLHSLSSKVAVFEWMKQKLVLGTPSEEEQKLIYAVLKLCISSLTEIYFGPQVTVLLWEILLNIERTSSEILDCFLSLLQNSHFVKYFVFHNDELVKIVNKYVEILKPTNVDVDVKTSGYRVIIHTVSRVNNNILVDNNLKLLFVESLMESLATVYDDLKNNLCASDFDVISVETLVYEVLFQNTDFKRAFLRNLLVSSPNTDSDLEQVAVAVIKEIEKYPTFMRPHLLTTSYSLILSGFLYSNLENEEIFKVYIALNSFIYIRPISIDADHEKCVLLQDNVVTAIELTKLLLIHDLPLETEWKFSFSTWLSALIDAVLNKLENEITSQLLNLLKNLLAFSPVLVEDNVKKLTKSVMLSKKSGQDVLKAHSDFCLYVLNVHIRLNRIHKLISALLITIKENLPNFEIEDVPSKYDVFPAEVFDSIQSAVTNLPSTVQNVALLNTLFFHLESDCIVALESDTSKEVDTRWLLLYDIISFLISRFVRGTRVVDHSVPDVVKSKFLSLMDSLAVLLGRFGKAIISKSHVPQLCESFLHLCLVWGDMQMLFMIYETQPRKVPKQVGSVGKAPTNLVYLHPYLSDFHWKIIAQRVMNFGGDNCLNLLNDLVLQKINAIPYLEDELQGPYVENIYDDGPSVVCAQYLINHANPKWLFSHISEFVHLLKPADIFKLSKMLMNHCQQCNEKEINEMLSDDFRELRPLVVAMMCYSFHSLSKQFTAYHLKEMKRMLRRIDYEEMLKAEDHDIEAVKALGEKLVEISSLLSTDFVHSNVDIPGDSFKTDLHILNNLPIRYLRRENKSLACLLTLSLMKNLVRLKFVNYNACHILLQSCKLLQTVLTGTNIPESVDCGKLLAWFYHGLKDTSYCDLVLESICRATKKYGCGVDRVIEIIKAVHNDNRTDVFIESESEGVDLLTSYLVNFEKIKKRREEDREVTEKLEKLCYENFDMIFESSPETEEKREKQLALYTILLRQALTNADEERLERLLARLPQSIELSKQFEKSSSKTFSSFIFILLKYYRKLAAHLPGNFFINTWGEFFYALDTDVISILQTVTSLENYNEMMQLLFANTEGSLREPVDEDVEILGKVWKIIVDTPVKAEKMIVKRRMVQEFCRLAHQHMALNRGNESVPVTRFFLKIFTSIVHNKAISLQYDTIDVCFSLVTFVSSSNCNELSTLSECAELLFIFCALREKHLLDRIPSFYLCYKSLFTCVVHKCRVEEGNDPVVVATAAHKMEKLTDSLVKNKKDFTKTAISAIGDFLGVVATVNLIEAVKNHVKNVIYCWIGICDTHGLQYLSAALPSASQTLFKQYWADYSKYYKFSGKV